MTVHAAHRAAYGAYAGRPGRTLPSAARAIADRPWMLPSFRFAHNGGLAKAAQPRPFLAWTGAIGGDVLEAYRTAALAASALVLDAQAATPAAGRITVTVLSAEGDGTASPELLEVVAQALGSVEGRRPADQITVRSARILPYRVEALLQVLGRADERALRARAYKALAAYVEQRRRLGGLIALSDLRDCLQAVGPCRVDLRQPSRVVTPGPDEAGFCTEIQLRLVRQAQLALVQGGFAAGARS